MAEKNPTILKISGDPQVLMKTAVEFARSEYPGDHNVLLEYLAKEDFLSRLDTAEDYLGPPRGLRLARVIKELMKNPSAYGRQVLVSLTQESGFTSLEQRQDLLIRALVVVRPAPAEAVRFWDEHSMPDSPHVHVTIDALADNGSPNALTLLQQKLADPQIDPDFKVMWMRDPILRHRNEYAMLETCGRMLAGGIPPEFAPDLVEALCDYRRDWYLSCEPPVAPPRQAMSSESRNLLQAIANYALQNISLHAHQVAAVHMALIEIGAE